MGKPYGSKPVSNNLCVHQFRSPGYCLSYSPDFPGLCKGMVGGNKSFPTQSAYAHGLYHCNENPNNDKIGTRTIFL